MDRVKHTDNRMYRYSGFLMSLSLFFLTLSGMAQMPISKRYYIADIPGLGWLADFYITHYIHYVSGFLFILLAFYYIADYFINKVSRVRITRYGFFRLLVLTVLFVSGIIMMIKNFSLYIIDPSGIVVLNLTHLAFAMLLIVLVIAKRTFKLNYWNY